MFLSTTSLSQIDLPIRNELEAWSLGLLESTFAISLELARLIRCKVLYVQERTFIFSGEESFRERERECVCLGVGQTSFLNKHLDHDCCSIKNRAGHIGFQPIFTRDTRRFVPLFFLFLFFFFSPLAISPVNNEQSIVSSRQSNVGSSPTGFGPSSARFRRWSRLQFSINRDHPPRSDVDVGARCRAEQFAWPSAKVTSQLAPCHSVLVDRSRCLFVNDRRPRLHTRPSSTSRSCSIFTVFFSRG